MTRVKLTRAGLVAPLVVALACTEQFETTAGCPALCPGQSAQIVNVTLEATLIDTTVVTPIPFGTNPVMLLAARGDTLDARIIVRYDSLPRRYRKVADDTTTTEITTVDSAFVRLRLDTTEKNVGATVTVEAYDVDTTALDTNTAAVLALFRPDRLIGSTTFAASAIADSIRVPISNTTVLAKARTGGRLRLGFRIAGSGQFHVYSSESNSPPFLSYKVDAVTTVPRITSIPISKTPTDDERLRVALGDYNVFFRTPPAGSALALNVGGLPARRVYFRFTIPSSIIDSSDVVRATLLLTQTPNRSLDPADTVGIITQVVVAGAAITDITQATTLVAEPEFTQADTLFVAAGDSGVKSIDIATLLRIWRQEAYKDVPRALILRSLREGASALEARFFSAEAASALRPRLRISYTPRNPFGLP